MLDALRHHDDPGIAHPKLLVLAIDALPRRPVRRRRSRWLALGEALSVILAAVLIFLTLVAFT